MVPMGQWLVPIFLSHSEPLVDFTLVGARE